MEFYSTTLALAWCEHYARDWWQNEEKLTLLRNFVQRQTALYSGKQPARSRVPNCYFWGTYKPGKTFSKRVYRSEVQEILARIDS